MASKKDKKGKKTLVVQTANGKPMVQDSVERFMQEFIKNGGNVGQAAMKVGNFSSLQSATVSGSRWLEKAKQRGLLRHALEKKGYDYGKLVDVALEKMEASKKPDWWDRIMKMANYEDFVSAKQQTGSTNIQTQVIFNAHRKLSEDYIDAEEGDVIEGEPAQDED